MARCALILFLAASGFLAAQEKADGSAPWWSQSPGAAYQILVYSFADSDGDGWGDIEGVIGKLDYLNSGGRAGDDLGVQAIWLSPIHEASSYHGYDVLDYKSVSSRYGSLEDFDRLAAECHRRGIKLIMDMVFNHSSREHPWFKSFLSDPAGPYGGYYVRKKEGLKYGTGGQGRFYAAQAPVGPVSYFSSFAESMPDLDCANPAVMGEFKDILSFWISHGADGFRFDAAKHVFDVNESPAGSDSRARSRAFWEELRAFARLQAPGIFFLGEVSSKYPSEISSYASCLDSLFDFPTARLALEACCANSGASFQDDFDGIHSTLYGRPGFTPAPFLSNHDQDRTMSVLLTRQGLSGTFGAGKAAGDGAADAKAKAEALSRAKLAASILMTLPGLPFIYYGEELGMAGHSYAGDDVSRRDAMPWTQERSRAPNATWGLSSGKLEPGLNRDTPSAALQEADPDSLLRHYRNLAALRRSSPALQGGSWSRSPWQGFDGQGLISYVREAAGQRLLVIHNPGLERKTIAAPRGIRLYPVFDSKRPFVPSSENEAGGLIAVDALSSLAFAF
jgi:glycosidase